MSRTATTIDATGNLKYALSLIPAESGRLLYSFHSPTEYATAVNEKDTATRVPGPPVGPRGAGESPGTNEIT